MLKIDLMWTKLACKHLPTLGSIAFSPDMLWCFLRVYVSKHFFPSRTMPDMVQCCGCCGCFLVWANSEQPGNGFCRAPVLTPLKAGRTEVKAGKRPDVVGSAKFNDSAGTSGASDLGNASFTELRGIRTLFVAKC
jgi:hypothetical protein